MEWTNDLVIKLIKEYEARPVLWDPSNNLFRIVSAKNEAWEEMSTEFDIEISDLKKKVQSVLASHRRENARVKARGKSNWFLYRRMKFLPNHVDFDDEGAEYETEAEADNQLEDDEDHMVTEYLEIPSEELTEQIIVKEEQDAPKKKILFEPILSPHPRINNNKTKRVYKRPQKVLKSKILYNDSSMTNHQTQTNHKTDYKKKKDECDSFGEYIATSLRKHDQRTRSMIKHAINNILFEQEMKKYSPGMQYALVPNDGENPLILGDAENHEDM